jgi:hypothetical protein
LKNHALLLFGPSSFEHWFKSCKSFSVRSLLFSEIANQSSASFLPLSSSWRLCSLLCPLVLPAAGVMRRSWPPPVISCAPPLPRVASPSSHRSSPLLLASHPSATSSTGCQHRTPEFLPPPQYPCGHALSLPLFCSVAPATPSHLVSLAFSLAKPLPSAVSSLSSSLRHRSRPHSSPAYTAIASPRPNPADPELPHLLPLPHIVIRTSPGPSPRRICSTPSRPSIGAAELGFTVDSPPRHSSVQSMYVNRLPTSQ